MTSTQRLISGLLILSGLVAFLGSLTGCPKPAEVNSAVLGEPPRLPAPRSGTYARVIEAPKDPVVARLVAGRRWDASMAGAASGLALAAVQDEGGFSRREIREAAWQAGYPYPIQYLAVWPTEPKKPPPDDLLSWLEDLDEDVDIGLVRARNLQKEIWVALASRPLVDLGAIPRHAALQTPLQLPSIPNATLSVADGQGRMFTMPMTETTTIYLDNEGEWLFALSDGKGDLARFTVYVGIDVPTGPVLEGGARSFADAEAAQKRSYDLLSEARQAYGASPWSTDMYLERAAGHARDREKDASGENSSELDLGLSQDQTYWLSCTARTVEDCVDQLLWVPEYRWALLSQETKFVGVAAELHDRGVDLIAVVATD